MRLYVYGILDSNSEMNKALYGLGGSGVYNVPYRDIGAVVSQIDQVAQARAEGHVLEHEAVVEKLMADFTILPMRFRTLVDGKDDLLSIMHSRYRDFKDNLQRLRNKVEFGVKVIWPADKVKENIAKSLERDGPEMLGPRSSPGTRFMNERFQEHKIDEEFQTRADHFVKVLDTFLGKFAAEKKSKRLKTEKLLLDAAYLVERSQECNFREAFWHIKNAHPGLKFLFSGPWPAYNFIVPSEQSGLAKDAEQANLLAGAARSQVLAGVDRA